MNDIKFRYYDKFNGVMSNPSDKYKCLGNFFADYDNFLYAGNNPKLMQFTGLQDKNGVDIYDGDIVDEKFKWAVQWKHDGWHGIVKSKPHNNCRLSKLIKLRKQALVPIIVIGNIYQNPELLEAK